METYYPHKALGKRAKQHTFSAAYFTYLLALARASPKDCTLLQEKLSARVPNLYSKLIILQMRMPQSPYDIEFPQRVATMSRKPPRLTPGEGRNACCWL